MYMLYNFKKVNKNSGFTIVEMLVAVLIFSLSLTAIITVASKSLKTSKNSEEQLIADYLALEAIEVVHNLRDDAILRNYSISSWDLVFQGGGDIVGDDEGCFNGPGYCNFYFQPGDAQPVLDKCIDCTVYLNRDNFYYFQVHEPADISTSFATDYKRKINIVEGSDVGQINVIVEVTWTGGRVKYVENLYLWQ